MARDCAARVITGLLISVAVYAQQIRVGGNVRISEPGISHVEPHIAAHPQNPRRLLVSVSHFERGTAVVEAFTTGDAGASWQQSHLPGLQDLLESDQLDAAADARVTYAADGEAYLSLIAVTKGDHRWGRSPFLFYRSGDGGKSWNGPTVQGQQFDRPTLLISGGSIFVALMKGAAATLLESTDRGASFREIVAISPDTLGHQPMGPVLSRAGSLIIPYVDFPLHRENLHASRVYIVRSNDRSTTFGAPVFVADIPRASPGSLESASVGDAIYLVWNGGPEGHQDLSLARSTDNGETWTTRVISPDASFGAIAAAENGTLGLAWIRHAPAQPDCWNVYFSASTDHGLTFSGPAMVSTALSCVNAAAKNTAARFRRSGANYGDYIGLASASDGTFHPVWLDARDGSLDVYTSSITVR